MSAYAVTTIRPTTVQASEILACYFPRNKRDTPESEKKLPCFAVLPLPAISISYDTVEGRYIRQALQAQFNNLLADAVAAGMSELPVFTLADLLEAAEESGSDGIGRLSKEKITHYIEAQGITEAAAVTIAKKASEAKGVSIHEDHPSVQKKLEEITAMLCALANRAPVVETWLATAEAFISKYFDASDAMTQRLNKAIEAKREQNRKALELAKVSADDF